MAGGDTDAETNPASKTTVWRMHDSFAHLPSVCNGWKAAAN
jgi:hypothetical protein